MRLEEIPFKGIDGKGNVFWDKIISSFKHYLGSAAHQENVRNVSSGEACSSCVRDENIS
jgi:hypothetical protein